MGHEKKDIKDRLDFEYNINHKAFPLISHDDVFEQFYEGHISKLYSPKYPINIGLFELFILNLKGARKFEQQENLLEHLYDLSEDYDGRYFKIKDFIDDYHIDFENKDRIIYLKNLIIHPDHRGLDVMTELIKSIYLTMYLGDDNTLFFTNSTPIQAIQGDVDFYKNDYEIIVNQFGDQFNPIPIMVGDYYDINELPNDDEKYYYKLYSKMNSLNMKRFNDSHYFYYETEDDILKLFK